MPYYRPRMLAELTVPTQGNRSERRAADNDPKAVRVRVPIRRLALERNDHNHADECRLLLDWRDAGADPRLLKNAAAQVWLANADDSGNWTPSRENTRFMGILTKPARRAKEGEALSVELCFQDYTVLFLERKPFPTVGIPDYSQTLDDAWRRICDNVGWYNPDTNKIDSSVTILRDRIRLEGLDKFPKLGTAVAKRFASLGHVPVKPDTDAWAVWQQCVGMLGLISYIHLDECIVTTATNYYTKDDPPRLIWGRDIIGMDEGANPFRQKGIGITSFDPLTGTALEALWPPVGDQRIKHKRIVAKKAHDEAATRKSEDREYFAVPSVTDPAALLNVAKRVYEERSRHEIEGTVEIAEMTTDTVSGSTFDLLALGAGDNVRIEFDQADKEILAALGSIEQRVAYLVETGLEEQIAEIIARGIEDFALLDCVFFTKKVATTIEVTPEGGSYAVQISYVNRIKVDGNADAA